MLYLLPDKKESVISSVKESVVQNKQRKSSHESSSSKVTRIALSLQTERHARIFIHHLPQKESPSVMHPPFCFSHEEEKLKSRIHECQEIISHIIIISFSFFTR